MFKKLFGFMVISFIPTYNNSTLASNITFDHSNKVDNCISFAECRYIVSNSILSIDGNVFNNYVELFNEMNKQNGLSADYVKFENSNKKITFDGIKNTAQYNSLYINGLGKFKPDIIFNCKNNKINFFKIIGENINSFKIISQIPFKIKECVLVDTVNNKEKVYNTKNLSIVGTFCIEVPYSYFKISIENE